MAYSFWFLTAEGSLKYAMYTWLLRVIILPKMDNVQPITPRSKGSFIFPESFDICLIHHVIPFMFYFTEYFIPFFTSENPQYPSGEVNPESLRQS